jgi:nitroreductase
MNTFENIRNIIQQRRTVKPADMNGQKIDSALIHQLLELADWAPTHGLTEPWRFIVFENNAVQKFCADHAQLYKSNTSKEKYTEAKYEKLLHLGDTVSHIILVYMKRSEGNTIPVEEEFAAVAAATQNILLGAASLDIAVLWSTGGMTHAPAMKTYFNLATNDTILGLLYMGYSDQPVKKGERNILMADKVDWRS